MATIQKQAYLVTEKSDLHYNGVVAPSGSVVDDIPGVSIAWLVDEGYIVASGQPPADTAESDKE